MSTVRFNTHLPGYEVLSELGRSNARVLKARHVATGDLVAIKQFAFTADADTLRRFGQESAIMTGIVQPNIVRVREVQLSVAMPYIVMDFIEGGDLRSLLRYEGRLAVPTAIRLGLQLNAAFRAIHPAGIVHRDVKPENVLYRQLVSHELHFLLTDFGIAKIQEDADNRTRTGQSLMTYEYAAPEQFNNPRLVDKAADYYALGVVLYECLTGRVPFALRDETGLAQFMQQVLTAPLPAPTLTAGQPLPPGLTTLLTRLLTRTPADRLCDPDELELLLEQSRVEWLRAGRSAPAPPVMNQTVAGPVASAALPAVRDEPLTEPSRQSNQTGWVVGALVLTAVLIALAFGLSQRTVRPAVSPPTVQTDSSVQQTTNPPLTDADSTGGFGMESTGPDAVPADDAGPESATQAAADSASGMTTADSATVIPPDSTL